MHHKGNEYIIKTNAIDRERRNLIKTRGSQFIAYSIDPGVDLQQKLKPYKNAVIMPYFGESAINQITAEKMEAVLPKMLESIFELHGLDIIHGDIKLDNFAINGNNVRLLDLEQTKAQLSMLAIKRHQGDPPSYKHDIESFAYILMQFEVWGELPWLGCSKEDTLLAKLRVLQKETLPGSSLRCVQDFIRLADRYDDALNNEDKGLYAALKFDLLVLLHEFIQLIYKRSLTRFIK